MRSLWRHASRNQSDWTRAGERGAATTAIAVLATISLILTSSLASATVARHAPARAALWAIQARSLAEAGIAVGSARLAADPEYTTGESPPSEGTPDYAWALAAAAAHPAQSLPGGEYVVLVPTSRDVIYGVGYAPARDSQRPTVAVLRAVLAPGEPPGGSSVMVLLAGDVIISNARIESSVGGLHINGTLTLGDGAQIAYGVTITVTQTVSISTSAVVNGTVGEGASSLFLPSTRSVDLAPFAMFVLGKTGWISAGPAAPPPYKPGQTICHAQPTACMGWSFKVIQGRRVWTYAGDGSASGVYQSVESDVVLSPRGPWTATVAAEGSVEVTTASPITAMPTHPLIVADGDLAATGATLYGQIIVHEQLRLRGASTWDRIVVRSASHVHNTVIGPSVITSGATIRAGVLSEESPPISPQPLAVQQVGS